MMGSSRRRGLLAIVSGLVLLASLTGCTGNGSGSGASDNDQRFVSGDGTVTQYQPGHRPKAPKLTGDLLDGTAFKLSSLRGSVVVLNFWGSWCAPCRAEAQHLIQVANDTQAKGVRFVGVNVRDSKDTASAFDRTHNVPYPSIYDPAGRVALAFRQTPPNTIPATIVIDREGRIAAVFRKAVIYTELSPVVTKVAA